MDTSEILRPHELPFFVPDCLAKATSDLIAAIERDDRMNIDCYINEIESAARSVNENKQTTLCM